jgi:hypothetical protein
VEEASMAPTDLERSDYERCRISRGLGIIIVVGSVDVLATVISLFAA